MDGESDRGWNNQIFNFGWMRNLRFSMFEVWYLSDGIHGHPSASMDIPGHGHRKILEEDRRRRRRVGEGVKEDASIDVR